MSSRRKDKMRHFDITETKAWADLRTPHIVNSTNMKSREILSDELLLPLAGNRCIPRRRRELCGLSLPPACRSRRRLPISQTPTLPASPPRSSTTLTDQARRRTRSPLTQPSRTCPPCTPSHSPARRRNLARRCGLPRLPRIRLGPLWCRLIQHRPRSGPRHPSSPWSRRGGRLPAHS